MTTLKKKTASKPKVKIISKRSQNLTGIARQLWKELGTDVSSSDIHAKILERHGNVCAGRSKTAIYQAILNGRKGLNGDASDNPMQVVFDLCKLDLLAKVPDKLTALEQLVDKLSKVDLKELKTKIQQVKSIRDEMNTLK